MQKGVVPIVGCLDLIEACPGELGGRQLFVGDLGGQAGGVEPDDVGHCGSPRILGTAKRPSTASGAWASASCWVRHGVISSGRVTLTSLSGLPVASTPVTSTAWIALTWVRMASSWL